MSPLTYSTYSIRGLQCTFLTHLLRPLWNIKAAPPTRGGFLRFSREATEGIRSGFGFWVDRQLILPWRVAK
jgi:hypothetical protein